MRLRIIAIIIGVIDFFYKLKIKNFLKNKRINFNILIDVGAHHGESINFFLKNFNVKTIY
jgi:hypothetical protein